MQQMQIELLECPAAVVGHFMDQESPPCPYLPDEIEAAVASVRARLDSGDWTGLRDAEIDVIRLCSS